MGGNNLTKKKYREGGGAVNVTGARNYGGTANHHHHRNKLYPSDVHKYSQVQYRMCKCHKLSMYSLVRRKHLVVVGHAHPFAALDPLKS